MRGACRRHLAVRDRAECRAAWEGRGGGSTSPTADRELRRFLGRVERGRLRFNEPTVLLTLPTIERHLRSITSTALSISVLLARAAPAVAADRVAPAVRVEANDSPRIAPRFVRIKLD